MPQTQQQLQLLTRRPSCPLARRRLTSGSRRCRGPSTVTAPVTRKLYQVQMVTLALLSLVATVTVVLEVQQLTLTRTLSSTSTSTRLSSTSTNYHGMSSLSKFMSSFSSCKYAIFGEDYVAHTDLHNLMTAAQPSLDITPISQLSNITRGK
jgi:hypothetical protein